MTPADLLTDALGRTAQGAEALLDGLTEDDLAQRPATTANSIAWLVWHLTRIQDDHVADVAGSPQVWTEQGYADRFELPFGDGDTGFGHSPDQVAQVRAPGGLLLDYLRAVHARSVEYLARLAPTTWIASSTNAGIPR